MNHRLLKCLALIGLSLTFVSCGGNTSSSLRSQLEAPTNLIFDFEAGTFSFTAVENATYYRVYFYNVTEPSDTIGNTEYFVSHTETITETYPDGQTGTREETVYDTDENGNYVLKSIDEILECTPTFSKRFNAQYYDENGDRQTYQAGETVIFDLPNSNIGGGSYYVAIKSGGPIALYTLSDFMVTEDVTKLILHNVDPEITLDYSTTFSQYGTTEREGMFGTTNILDETNIVLEDEGMMFEISNADTFYNANADIMLEYTIEDASGSEVTFSYENIRMKRNDSNTFCGWEEVENKDGVTQGTASVSHYIYSHSGPTMEYQTTGFFYVIGLEEGADYTLKIMAPGDDGVSSYDSDIVEFEFTYEITSLPFNG